MLFKKIEVAFTRRFPSRSFLSSEFPLRSFSSSSTVEPLRLSSRNSSPRMMKRDCLVLGSVCYAESVASIWKGMMRHFARNGLDVDFVLYTSYDRQVHAVLSGEIDIAWNGPLAHGRLCKLTGTGGLSAFETSGVIPLGMRDSDRDFVSRVIVRNDSKIKAVSDLQGRRIATGTVDSPQAYIHPLAAIAKQGVDLKSLTVLRFDRDIGKHGDTAYGEDAVLDALVSGSAEAGFISDLMWQRYITSGKTTGLHSLPIESIPSFDHCQFDAIGGKKRKVPFRLLEKFQNALLAQKIDGSLHFEETRTMQLEGIKKEWLPPRAGTLDHLVGPSSSLSLDFSKGHVNQAASIGYENMIQALTLLGDNSSTRWPGVMHTTKRHPFKHLLADYTLVRDALGC